jgi:CheY-like chemotaxis protein
MHPSGWACVRVEDSGPGLRPEQLDLVFEPFRQGPEFIGRSRGGLGLGLALVKGLVALHGGQVSVTSAGPGRGSQFTIRLPLLQAPCPAPAPAPAEASPVSAGPGAHRVLIVEDMADSALTLQLLLRTLGHTAQTAADGHAGLDQARRFNPDVILCDIGLPGSLSGYDVARTLRALPESKGVLLIALSGFGTPADKRRAAEAGFDLHLTKPVDPAILETLLGSAGPP